MATTQEHAGMLMVGLHPGTPNAGVATQAMNAANTWLAYGFVPTENRTLAKVKAYVSAVTATPNTPIAADYFCDVFSDTAGTGPNASLTAGAGLTVPASVPASGGSGWVEWTGGSVSLTAGTMYWLVFKNLNASPTTKYMTYRFGGNNAGGQHLGNAVAWGWVKRLSTDGGSTWAAGSVAGTFGVRLEYSDTAAHYDGLPYYALGNSTRSVYGGVEAGWYFTTPANCNIKLRGVAGVISKTSSGAGAVLFRLYTGATLTASTYSIPAGNITNQSWVSAFFSSAQTLAASTTYRVVFSSSAGDSSNNWKPNAYTIEDDANSKALTPFGDSQVTYTDDNTATPVVWTEISTQVPIMSLILDTDGEFAASGGAGGGLPILGGSVVR